MSHQSATRPERTVDSVTLFLKLKARMLGTNPLRMRGVWKFPFTSIWLSAVMPVPMPGVMLLPVSGAVDAL